MSIRLSALLAEVSDLPAHEIRRLFLTAAGVDVPWMMGDPSVGRRTATRFRSLVDRRRRGEPLQYIEGTVQFGPLELKVDPRALIPRPETERLWEIVVEMLRGVARPIIVDLGTGSGNLALACRYQYPDGRVVGIDLSSHAIELARQNAVELALEVEFIQSDLFNGVPEDLRGRVDLVVSNPPYVALGEVAALPAEVRDHEPRRALVPGVEGTEILARIAAGLSEWLRPGGFVACEIGETQADECLQLFRDVQPRIEIDLSGRPRYLLGRAPE